MRRREFLALAGVPFFSRRRKEIEIAGIRFRVVREGKSPHRYIHIHGNETTARDVLLEHVRAHGGTAIFTESEARYVEIGGGRLDPNRMFSREGSSKNLRMLNPSWSEAQIANASMALDRGRKKFFDVLRPPKGGRIVALHNNSSGYSVESEVAISDKKSLADAKNPHEFFLATELDDYTKIASSPYNVVLQHSAPPDDDGSLSRLSVRMGVRYVNLECGIGKIERQREMLGWLEANLP